MALIYVDSSLAVLSNQERDVWISRYHKQGSTRLDICGFLLFLHNSALSLSQLKWILRRLGLKRRNASSPLLDVIRAIHSLYKRGMVVCGYKTIWKLVNTTTNVKVTQETTWCVLKVIDPEGVALRSAHRLRRRVYTNKCPNTI